MDVVYSCSRISLSFAAAVHLGESFIAYADVRLLSRRSLACREVLLFEFRRLCDQLPSSCLVHSRHLLRLKQRYRQSSANASLSTVVATTRALRQE